MVSFLVWRVPKLGSYVVISDAISVQVGTIRWELRGDQVCVPRPSMEAMDEDVDEDFDFPMPGLTDSDDEELDRDRHTFTPRGALGDVRVSGLRACTVSCPAACQSLPPGTAIVDSLDCGLCA